MSAGSMVKALSVGKYPAACFTGWEPEKDHRRFLRRLAKEERIRLRDSVGNVYEIKALENGTAHFDDWYVDEQDALVIQQEIEEEATRLAHEQEARQMAHAEQQEEKRRKAAAKKKRVAELKGAGMWDHPAYRTIYDAYADGWHNPSEDECGGEIMVIRGRTLVRNTESVKYVYKSTLSRVYGMTPSMIRELGQPDKTCENPHWKSGPYEASLYLLERVEAWVEENQGRLETARQSRANRSAAMKAVHQKKQTERLRQEQEESRTIQAWVQTLTVVVESPLPDSLRENALKWKNRWGTSTLDAEKAIRNHVRHRYTNYDKLLQVLSKSEFYSFEAYPFLRQRMDAVVEVALAEWEKNRPAPSMPGASTCGK